MKVLFVITELEIGGAEKQITELSLRLKKRGWDVSVISLKEEGYFAPRLRQGRVPVVALKMRKLSFLKGFAELKRYVKNWKPALIHTHLFHPNVMLRLVKLLIKFPSLVCSVHSIREGGNLRGLMYRLTDGWCNLVSFVSRKGMERYIRKHWVRREKAVWIPNGVDVDVFRPEYNGKKEKRKKMGFGDEFLWLAVGNLRRPKDYPTLLNAFRIVLETRPDSFLLIAGEGPLRKELVELTRKLGLEQKVFWLGKREDVPDLIRIADGFVMSSLWEGMPNVLLEAQASGLPAVATSVGDVEWMILEGQTGFVVPPSNPEALADRMVFFMNLPPDLREEMGKKARSFVLKNFSMEKIVDRWEQTYQNLLRGNEIET